MDTAHRNLLRKNRLALSEDLDAKTATSYLYSEDIISEHDKEDIETAKTQRDKSEKLLDILPKRGPHAFEVFLKFLDDKQPHLSKLLQGVPEECKGPTGNTDFSVPSPPEGKPAAKTDPYNFSSNPRSVSSTFPIQVASTPGSTNVDGHTITTDTQHGGITSSNIASENGADQGDGSRNSRLFFPPKNYIDGVDERDIYPMRNNPRGLAFIINNKNFEPASGMEKYPRNGTDVDAEALEKLFKDLKFVTTVYRNKGTQDIFDIVDQYATADYSRYDCFMCAILTHGGEGLIYSTDGQIQIKDLISKFRAGNLTGKPKIFFFQDCQGYEYMEGVDQHDAVIGLDFDEVDPGSNRITIPTEADFLFAYSTVPGYYSWRNSGRGSWFVQAIVSVFHQHALTMDLLRMLTRVNSEVAKWKSNTESEVSRNKKQIPCVISQLRKELYFFPEKVVDPE